MYPNMHPQYIYMFLDKMIHIFITIFTNPSVRTGYDTRYMTNSISAM